MTHEAQGVYGDATPRITELVELALQRLVQDGAIVPAYAAGAPFATF